MGNDTDASLVGQHCQFEYCNQLDFLPFQCQSCGKSFCSDHRCESAHECEKAGAWAERTRQAREATPSAGQGAPADKKGGAEKACDSPRCKTVIYTSLTPGVHCRTCGQDYCLKHRMEDEHDCKALVAAAKANDEVAQRKRTALERLRAWGASRPRPPTWPKNKPKAGPNVTRVLARHRLRSKAKGQASLEEENRIYLFVEAAPDARQGGGKKGEFFYNKNWVVGRVLDEAAKSLQVENINNRTTDEKDRLCVFHVEGGRVMRYNEKISEATETGDTIVLVRGIGPPPPATPPPASNKFWGELLGV